jgi:hypothetical protein
MIFKKRLDEPESEPTYTYDIFPDMIPDGDHEFDGIRVSFAKPGWQWTIFEHNEERWPRVHSIGDGFPTRDAALVDLLKTVKNLNGEVKRE